MGVPSVLYKEESHGKYTVPLAHKIFLPHLIYCFLSLSCKRCKKPEPGAMKHPYVIFKLHFDQLWFSVIVSAAKDIFLDV